MKTKKFDLRTLKPFDLILVRDHDLQEWRLELFQDYTDGIVHSLGNHCCNQVVPYNHDTKYLFDIRAVKGFVKTPPDYYKTWEDVSIF